MVMQIWLDGNLQAHYFIASEYWQQNYDFVKQMLPQSKVYVYEDEKSNQIKGFIGLQDEFIAGVFFFIEEEVCVFFFVRTYRLAGIFHNPVQSRAKLRFILRKLSKALFKRNIKLPVIVHACLELLEIGHEIYNRTVEIYKIKNK